MVDPTTVNLVMAQPLRGTDVGTWDVPVNGNTGILDQAFGSVTTLALSSASVTLAASQAQNSIIRLTGTLTSSVAITLASIYKFWIIDNQLTNSPSSFSASLVSTSGASIIGCPPGIQEVFYDGTTPNYRSLGKVGEYWDYAAATVPTWVTVCTKPPYLNCNGTTFSSATYPILANLLGTTTLPDSRGRFRSVLNQGTGRMTTGGGGVDGNTAYAAGGADSITLASSQMPTHNHATNVTDPGHTHTYIEPNGNTTTGGGGFACGGPQAAVQTGNSVTGISVTTQTAGGGGAHANIGPTYVGGITMIRAA